MAKIDHIGIAVKSLAASKAIYEKLGLTISPEETVEQEQVRLVMVARGRKPLGTVRADFGRLDDREVYRQAGRGIASRVPASSGFTCGC